MIDGPGEENGILSAIRETGILNFGNSASINL